MHRSQAGVSSAPFYGESTQKEVLRPGDTVHVNGTEFTYGIVRKRRD